MGKGKPFAGYIRVSDFDSGAGHSPDWQRRIIEQAARARGDQIVFPVEPDLNVSGALAADERALGTLMTGCAEGKYAGIYVWRVSRFGRNAGESLVNVRRLTKDLGCHVVSVEDGADSRSPGWKTTFGLMAIMAEDELDRIAAVWDRARKGAIERGVHVSSTVPFGYRRGDDGRLEPDPDESPVVREVFKRKVEGKSLTQLAAYLDSTGLKPRRAGKAYKPSKQYPDGHTCGDTWTRSSLQRLLANRSYLGEAKSGDYLNESAHTPILEEETFLAAQRAGKHRAKTGRLSAQAMLAGLVRCAGCGRAMQVGRQWSGGKASERATYYCRGHSSDGKCTAPAWIAVSAVDSFVESVLLEYFEGEGPIADSIRAATKVEERQAIVAEAQGILDKLLANTRLIAALGEDEYATAVESAKRDLELAKADLAEVKAAAELTTGLDGDMLSSWPTLDVLGKRRVVSTLLDRVVLRRSSKRGGPFHPSRVQIVWRDHTVVTHDPDGFVLAPEDPALELAA